MPGALTIPSGMLKPVILLSVKQGSSVCILAQGIGAREISGIPGQQGLEPGLPGW